LGLLKSRSGLETVLEQPCYCGTWGKKNVPDPVYKQRKILKVLWFMDGKKVGALFSGNTWKGDGQQSWGRLLVLKFPKTNNPVSDQIQYPKAKNQDDRR